MKFFNGLILIFIALISCSTPSTPTEETAQRAESATPNTVMLTPEQIKSLGIQVGKLEERQLTGTVKATGVLDVPPQNLVTISAPMGGFVKQTDLLQGMSVKKGQLIVVLEDPDYIQLQQDYLDGKSQLEFLELEYKRQEELSKENVNALKALQLSKSNYLSAKAKVEGWKARLKLIHIQPEEIERAGIINSISILSPITGFVMQVNVNIGMHVDPTDVMFKIVDTDHLHAEAQVFEKDINQLKVGQTVRITLSNEFRERTAKVFLIGKEITAERTVRVHCHLDKTDHSLIPGMYFSAIFEIGDKPVLTAPDNAIVNYEGKYFLFVVRPDQAFELREVQTGTSQDGYTEVILPEGFDSATSIVTQGTYPLISKLKNVEDE